MTTTLLSAMECRAVQFDHGIPDYALRMGDLVPAPEGGYGRVALVFSPRVVIVRVPYWHDYLWMWAPLLLDRVRYGKRLTGPPG